MTRRLKTIARWINESMPGYSAEIREGYCSTDRKPQGVRWRIPGKGRTGTRIVVRKGSEVVLDHNSAETYRSNKEVEDWIRREIAGNL